jgi:hypothetical protein
MASSTEPATPHLPPRRNPMSKLALMLVGVFGLICLACCGGTWFVDQSSEHEEFTDVDSVTAVAAEIAHLDLPSHFRAKRAQSIRTMFEDVSAALWQSEKGSVIFLGQVSEPFDSVTSDVEAVLAKLPLGRNIQRPPSYSSGSGVTVDVEIHGEKIQFDIEDLAMWGMPGVRQTSGVFPTADGGTGIIYIRTELAVETTPEEIENILHSIR